MMHTRVMNACLLSILFVSSRTIAQSPVEVKLGTQSPEPRRELVVVTGAAGEAKFGDVFQSNAVRWQKLAEKQKWRITVLGTADGDLSGDRELLKQAIEKAVLLPAEGEFWLVLIGHGTFSGNVAKFNLVGPDVSATELAEWLKPVRAKCIIINCSSCSGPFLSSISGANRIVVTATRSGSEQNFSHFGEYLADSISSLSADLDHDQEVSLFEAFLAASSQTERFYREDARLATEHGLLDDNGDRVGTGSDFFRGVRPAKQPEKGKQIDGRAASREILFSAPDAPQFTSEQRVARREIEEKIDALRERKAQLSEDTYLGELEQLCLELSKLYESIRASAHP